jgi:exosortase E/protease (VPEID-CTERM system)
VTSLGIWRAGFVLVLLVQLIVLHDVAQGQFGGLVAGGKTEEQLFYLHTFTKFTLLATMALIASTVIGGHVTESQLLPKRRACVFLVLHIIAMVTMMILVPTLPVGSESSDMKDRELWRYAAFSGAFLAWQLTALCLGAPYRLIAGWHAGRAVLIVSVIIAIFIRLLPGDSFLLNSLRAMIEDSTMELSVAFYTLFGAAEPTLSMHNKWPVLEANGFAIQVAPDCAGYQGMLVSAIVMFGLIALEWSKLQHERVLMLGLAVVVAIFVFNALRIALLFHIGVSYSPEMALNGFHSYFGTLSLLIVVGAAMLVMQHPFFRQARPAQDKAEHLTLRKQVTDPYAEAGKLILPLAIYLAIGMVLGLFNGGFNWTYPLLAIAGLGLMAFWRSKIGHEFSGRLRLDGFVMGLAIYLLWLAVVPSDPEADAAFAAALNAVPLSLMLGWILFRLIGFSIVVPVLEELAFRGGLQRLIESKLSKTTGRGAAAMIAFALSSLAFGIMHADVLAGTLAGAGFGLLVLRSGRVGDAIIAHAVTNFLLAVTAIATDHWSLW